MGGYAYSHALLGLDIEVAWTPRSVMLTLAPNHRSIDSCGTLRPTPFAVIRDY
jgi:hypothetical protein